MVHIVSFRDLSFGMGCAGTALNETDAYACGNSHSLESLHPIIIIE